MLRPLLYVISVCSGMRKIVDSKSTKLFVLLYLLHYFNLGSFVLMISKLHNPTDKTLDTYIIPKMHIY